MLGHVGFFLFASGQAAVAVTLIGWVVNLKSRGAYGAKTHIQAKHPYEKERERERYFEEIKGTWMISLSHGPLLLQAQFSDVHTPEAPERLCVAIFKCA